MTNPSPPNSFHGLLGLRLQGSSKRATHPVGRNRSIGVPSWTNHPPSSPPLSSHPNKAPSVRTPSAARPLDIQPMTSVKVLPGGSKTWRPVLRERGPPLVAAGVEAPQDPLTHP